LTYSLDIPLQPGTYSFGQAFEHLIILEFIRLNDYLRKDFRFSYLRTSGDLEVDLVIERPGLPIVLAEIKSATQIDDVEIRKLKNITLAFKNAVPFILCSAEIPREVDGVKILPWIKGIEEIFLTTALLE
jgi:predicted AAA+ superfamily ATPase